MFFGFIAGGITFVVIIVVLCVGGLVAITTMGTSSNKTFGNVAGAVGGASKQKDKAK